LVYAEEKIPSTTNAVEAPVSVIFPVVELKEDVPPVLLTEVGIIGTSPDPKLLTKFVPLYTSVCPEVADVMATSDRSSLDSSELAQVDPE
jgi:hypothetical protein